MAQVVSTNKLSLTNILINVKYLKSYYLNHLLYMSKIAITSIIALATLLGGIQVSNPVLAHSQAAPIVIVPPAPPRICFQIKNKAFRIGENLTQEQRDNMARIRMTKKAYEGMIASYSIGNLFKQCLLDDTLINGFDFINIPIVPNPNNKITYVPTKTNLARIILQNPSDNSQPGPNIIVKIKKVVVTGNRDTGFDVRVVLK